MSEIISKPYTKDGEDSWVRMGCARCKEINDAYYGSFISVDEYIILLDHVHDNKRRT